MLDSDTGSSSARSPPGSLSPASERTLLEVAERCLGIASESVWELIGSPDLHPRSSKNIDEECVSFHRLLQGSNKPNTPDERWLGSVLSGSIDGQQKWSNAMHKEALAFTSASSVNPARYVLYSAVQDVDRNLRASKQFHQLISDGKSLPLFLQDRVKTATPHVDANADLGMTGPPLDSLTQWEGMSHEDKGLCIKEASRRLFFVPGRSVEDVSLDTIIIEALEKETKTDQTGGTAPTTTHPSAFPQH